MRTKYIADGLLLHCLIVGTILLLVLIILQRRHLFHWLSTGFWAWAAFAFYFFIAPLIQFWGDPQYMEAFLAPTEGLSRMIWVTYCVAVGLVTFFWAYFRYRPGNPKWGLDQESWPPGTWIIIILALAGAAYSMIFYRGAFGLEVSPYELEKSSKFVGKVTGYQTALNICAIFPIILLLMRRTTRLLGLALAGIYLVGKLDDRYDRANAVSLVIAVSMALTFVRRRPWPSAVWVAGILLFTLLLQVRGHYSLTEFWKSGQMTVSTGRQEVKRGEGATMQATFYLKSYMHDKAGYTYGIPLVSSVVFGALPRRYFPWKDWMVETYLAKVTRAFQMEAMMFGGKSSVIGDLYGFGGIFTIAGGMFILGFLARKLDGLLSPQAPVVMRALGVVWLSALWIMLAGALLWTVALMFLTAAPFVLVVLCGKLFPSRRRSLVQGPTYPRQYLVQRP